MHQLNTLLQKLVDISTAPLIITAERNEVVTAGIGLIDSKTTITARRLTGFDFNMLAFVNVFMASAWAGLAAVIMALALGFMIIKMLRKERLNVYF